MIFNNFFLHFRQIFPIYTNHNIGSLDLPRNWLSKRKYTSFTVRVSLSFQDSSFQKLEANSTTTVSINKIENIREALTVKILFKLIKFNFFGLIFLRRFATLIGCIQSFGGVDLHVSFFLFLIFELMLIGYESFDLKIYQIVELFPPHPICEYDDERDVTQLHFVAGFIKISLKQADVILLRV